jgi:hypothetical protein
MNIKITLRKALNLINSAQLNIKTNKIVINGCFCKVYLWHLGLCVVLSNVSVFRLLVTWP